MLWMQISLCSHVIFNKDAYYACTYYVASYNLRQTKFSFESSQKTAGDKERLSFVLYSKSWTFVKKAPQDKTTYFG